MGETGVVPFPVALDPRAEEFRPRNSSPDAAVHLPQQIPIFLPLLPPPPPFPPVYYPYAAPFGEGGVVGCNQQYVGSGGYITAPDLPPQSAVPTRTLALSSVPSDVSESVIRRELEVFGEVRGVLMERIGEGVVTVYFYDLRHAEAALREIREQNMQEQSRRRNLFTAADRSSGFGGFCDGFLAPLPAARGLIAGCAVWAQFVIPSCNAVPDGHNHGTIVVFNLEPSVSSSSLKEIFQAFGAVKELRETPLKKQQRFIEFYDIRDATKALREMNGKEISGKQVVIEFSRPGGFSRKFFDSTATSKSSSITNKFMKSRISRFTPHYHPPPPPPPPPLHRRFPGRHPHDFANRGFISQTQKKHPKLCGLNPSERASARCTEAVTIGAGCLSLRDGENRDADSDAPGKIASSKKSQISESSTKQQQSSRIRPWKSSRQGKKFDTRFLINEEAMVESDCSDSRTTVMIKNIPNKYSQKLLLNMLDNHCIHCNEQIAEGGGDQPLSSYDFVYLPIDFNNKCNVGYGFVNMTSPQATLRLYKAFHHQHWEVFNSRKICEVTYARVQGLEALKEHFKNSKFPSEMDHYLPVVFSPPRDGKNLPDPQPVVGQRENPPTTLILLNYHPGEGSQKNSDGYTDPEEEEERTSSCSNGGDGAVDEEKGSCSSGSS